MSTFSWQRMQTRLLEAGTLKEGTYEIVSIDDKRITLTRLATGSVVRISRTMIDKTADRLSNGEIIAKRTISYTVAIETAVVAALGSRIREITLENGKRGYVADRT